MPRPSPLKAAAAAAGLTLTDVARRTGYSAGTIGQVSRGNTEPWPELRRRLEDLFGFDPFEDELDRVRRIVAATREAQGLPPTVADDIAIGRAADLLRTHPEAS